MKRYLRRAFLAASIGWGVLLPVATAAAGHTDSSLGFSAVALVSYFVGSLVCHQRPDRSFHLFAVQMPVCARCVGMYAGAAGAALVATLSEWSRPKLMRDEAAHLGRMRWLLIASALPSAATLMYELAAGTPGNWIRAASGVPLGAAVAWAVSSVM